MSAFQTYLPVPSRRSTDKLITPRSLASGWPEREPGWSNPSDPPDKGQKASVSTSKVVSVAVDCFCQKGPLWARYWLSSSKSDWLWAPSLPSWLSLSTIMANVMNYSWGWFQCWTLGAMGGLLFRCFVVAAFFCFFSSFFFFFAFAFSGWIKRSFISLSSLKYCRFPPFLCNSLFFFLFKVKSA